MNINKIVIAGAGTMGSSMAQIYAKYFDNVTLYNHREESLKKAEVRIKENVDTLVKSGNMTEQEADKLLGSLSYTTSMDCFKDCDFVAENLTENVEIKDTFYRELSDVVSDNTIITTNTSGLSINRRAQSVKKPVIVNKDVPGFAANRLQFAVLREALDLVKKGVVSPEGIDDVMKYGLGFRYACLGPLEVSDFGGLDSFYHISEYLMKDLCDDKEPPELLKQHFEAGEYGVKSAKGFYDYSDGRDKIATGERDEKFLKVYHALYEDK